MLFLENPEYTAVLHHKEAMDKFAASNVVFKTSYKSYDKKQGAHTTFRLWDLSSELSLQSGVVLGRIKYDGQLVFGVDEPTKEIIVHELPKVKSLKTQIAVCTSDLLEAIKAVVQKHVNTLDYTLKIQNPLAVVCIDEKAKDVFSGIDQSQAYTNQQNIISKIKSEEKKIAEDVKAYKKKLDHEEKAVENAFADKRKIFGIDPEQFESSEEAEIVIGNHIISVYEKRIESARRQSKSAETKLLQLIQENTSNFYTRYDIDDFEWGVCKVFEEIESGKLKDDDVVDLSKYDYDYEDSSDEDKFVKVSDLKQKYHERVIDKEFEILSEIISVAVANEIKAEVRCLRQNLEVPSDYTVYHALSEEMAKSRSVFAGCDFETQKRVIDLIRQMSANYEQINNYEYFIQQTQNSSALTNFAASSGDWGAVMQYPAWIRYGRDYRRKHGIYFHLLMTKPETREIDFENIKRFTRRDGYELAKEVPDRLSILSKIARGETERLENYDTHYTACLAESLSGQSLQTIVETLIEKQGFKQFVCESAETAVKVKRMVLSHFMRGIEHYKQKLSDVNNDNISPQDHERYWYASTAESEEERAKKTIIRDIKNELERTVEQTYIVVDPKYYSNFFKTTPTNFHLYWNYRGGDLYREGKFIRDHLDIENEDIIINQGALDEKLFGGYLSEPKYLSHNEFENTYHPKKLTREQWNEIIAAHDPISRHSFAYLDDEIEYWQEDDELLNTCSNPTYTPEERAVNEEFYDDNMDYGEFKTKIFDVDDISVLVTRWRPAFVSDEEEQEYLKCHPEIDTDNFSYVWEEFTFLSEVESYDEYMRIVKAVKDK
ncbi:MAG: hypothetical protein IJW24_02640, partial [Clostridia bacterium]|nr:hypothetical protein [Clostridia bacterium]